MPCEARSEGHQLARPREGKRTPRSRGDWTLPPRVWRAVAAGLYGRRRLKTISSRYGDGGPTRGRENYPTGICLRLNSPANGYSIILYLAKRAIPHNNKQTRSSNALTDAVIQWAHEQSSKSHYQPN